MRSRRCPTSSRPRPRSSSPARSSADRSAWDVRWIRRRLATPATRARERSWPSGRRLGRSLRNRQLAPESNRKSGTRTARCVDVRFDRPRLRPHEHDHDRRSRWALAPGRRSSCARIPRWLGLDVACGTGKLTAALAAAVGPTGRVVGVDLSTAMLEEARRAFGAVGPGRVRCGQCARLAVRCERLRRGHYRLRAAEPGELRGRFPRDGEGRAARRPGSLPGADDPAPEDRGALLLGRVGGWPRPSAGSSDGARPTPICPTRLTDSQTPRRWRKRCVRLAWRT